MGSWTFYFLFGTREKNDYSWLFTQSRKLAKKRFREARAAGYEVWIIAISTDIKKAIQWNLKRAEDEPDRRFVPLDVFIPSHQGFHDNIDKNKKTTIN